MSLHAVTAETARRIDTKLARILNEDVETLQAYLHGWIRPDGHLAVTGFRMVRGSHGCHYVRDPAGTDLLPAGWEEPA